MNVVLLTLVTMSAFAANTVLCRAALLGPQLDPASFTVIRLVSGAITLQLLLYWQSGQLKLGGSWPMAFALLGYAVFFSMAYVQLATGTGALVLFGLVQGTMIVWAATQGDRLSGWRAVGATSAVFGLVVLMWPALKAPESLFAVISMAIAGVSWGVFSILGKGSKSPLAEMTGNFVRAGFCMALLWVVVYVVVENGFHIPGVSQRQGLAFVSVSLPEPTLLGIALALASGCLASGLGYALWYKILPLLRTTSAASVQLSVPVLAALAGVIGLGEPLTARFVMAAALTLGGLAVVLLYQKP